MSEQTPGSSNAGDALASRRFAWDGVSFDLPADWDLAIYRFKRNLTRIEIEDRYVLRMEAEWTRPHRQLDMGRIQKRYDRQSRRLTREARRQHAIEHLPQGWVANTYTLKSDRQLLTAFYLAPGSKLFFFLMLHFDPEDPHDPVAILSMIASSFVVHDGLLTPWQLYDIRFELPSEWRLVGARFETGLKTMHFTWRLRQLWVYHVSLADMLLAEVPLDEWAPEFLNAQRICRAVAFLTGVAGHIDVRRHLRHMLGRYDELIRLCYRYQARVVHLPGRNQIVLAAMHYRRLTDVDLLDAAVLDE